MLATFTLGRPRNPQPLGLRKHRRDILMAGAEMAVRVGERDGVHAGSR